MTASLYEILNKLRSGTSLNDEEMIVAALLFCILFATVQFLTIVLTRWGYHRITIKSLIFSLVIHFTCGLGAVVVTPPIIRRVERAPPDEPVRLEQIYDEPENLVTIDGSDEGTGEELVWDQPSLPPTGSEVRAERKTEMEAVDATERKAETVVETSEPIPELANLPQQETKPEAKSDATRDLTVNSAVPLDGAAPEKLATEPAPSSEPRESRTPVTRSEKIETNVARQSVDSGYEEVIATPANPDVPLGVESAENTPVPKVSRDGGDKPATAPVGEPKPANVAVGAPEAIGTPGEPKGNTGEPRLARTEPTSPAITEDEVRVERQRPRLPAGRDAAEPEQINVPDAVPLVARESDKPVIERPNFDGVTRQTDAVPDTYRLRDRGKRTDAAARHGGTTESEEAVEASLKWLASQQNAEGYWDADEHGAGTVKTDENGVDRQNAGKHADTGVTALALLSFLAAGYTHDNGPYSDNVGRAIQWLVKQQRTDGYLGGKATHFEQMYCHGIATYALAEAFAMAPGSSEFLQEPLLRAVEYVLNNQNQTDGGWRYVKNQQSDMSMFGWQLMAIKSAELGGMTISSEAKQLMVKFLRDRSRGQQRGLAGYRQDTPPTPTMTAEALFSKQMLGMERDNAASKEAVDYLLQNLPTRREYNVYYWYYGTLAMFQYGGEPWEKWNGALRDRLIVDQIKTGANAGSWDPDPTWGRYGGRIYSTAVSTLCLEVYYRFLPLYRVTDDVNADGTIRRIGGIRGE